MRHRAATHRGRDRGHDFRLADREARQIERHRLCAIRSVGGGGSWPNESRRLRQARRLEGARSTAFACGNGAGFRRVFPIHRWSRGSGSKRRDGNCAARGIGSRQRSHRRRQPASPGDGLNRRAALLPLRLRGVVPVAGHDVVLHLLALFIEDREQGNPLTIFNEKGKKVKYHVVARDGYYAPKS